MLIVAEQSRFVTNTPEQIRRALATRVDGCWNDFFLSHDDEAEALDDSFPWMDLGGTYPAIQILVRDDLAFAYYYLDPDVAGYASLGSLERLPDGGRTEFWMAGKTPIWITNKEVIEVQTAVELAIEFASARDLPKRVEWLAL